MLANFFIQVLLIASLGVHASPIIPRNNDFLPKLLEYLRDNKLTSYAGELESWSQTASGQEFVGKLSYGKRTMYVASNKALAHGRRIRQTGSAQPMAWPVTDDGSNPGKRNNHEECGRVVRPTLWDDPEFVNLSGRPQVIDVYSDDHRILRGTTGNSTAKTVGTFRNIYVKEIDTVLAPPLSVKETLRVNLVDEAPDGFPGFGDAAQAAGLMDDLNNKGSTTVFLPVSFPSNANRNTIENHVLWGDVLYSTDLKDQDTTIAASGKTLKFEREHDQLYVILESVKARVIRSDVTTNNGVIHVIDKPLIG